MNCPVCNSENLSMTTIQVFVNTGARYICECGIPVNEDGTENEVLVKQVAELVNNIDSGDDDETNAVVPVPIPVLVGGAVNG